MIIKTRKLPATQTEPKRMRATATVVGDYAATLTIPYPEGSEDPHAVVAWMLAQAYGFDDVEKILAYNQFQATDSAIRQQARKW